MQDFLIFRISGLLMDHTTAAVIFLEDTIVPVFIGSDHTVRIVIGASNIVSAIIIFMANAGVSLRDHHQLPFRAKISLRQLMLIPVVCILRLVIVISR